MQKNHLKNSKLNDGKSKVLLRSLKVVALALVVLGLSFGVSNIGATVSYYMELESSLANMLRAGLIDIEVVRMAIPESPPNPVGEDSFTLDVEAGPGSLPFSYTAHIELDPGANSSCGNINVEALLGSTNITNSLQSFSISETTTLGMWLFSLDTVNVDPGILCEGTIIFDASNSSFTDRDSYHFAIMSEADPIVIESLSFVAEPPVEETFVEVTTTTSTSTPPTETSEE